ncbi:hypothetical protein L1987_85996 [Smallanthus sonchifolius]|uniref:Uncharacterized protein n=1 Tax=Smallanthus sonchifolius TaxID=185202 RepID=A0ACB8XZB3_9ASTR|nr:hypothetical protein L1987_85996 [Smallanthus sonchifolius]
MGNSLRCCLSCLLPCGVLDMIRIVHLNGFVEEITRPVTAGEVLTNYPNCVLTEPSSQGVVRRILILSSNTELKRGGIYFLIPASSVPENKRKPRPESLMIKTVMGDAVSVSSGGDLKMSSGVVVEKKVRRQRGRRSVDGGDWRPHLESICEE